LAHPPQLRTSFLRSTQAFGFSAGHAASPASQVIPQVGGLPRHDALPPLLGGGHTVPQAPQLLVSLVRSVHVPLGPPSQSVSVDGHVPTHTTPLHDTVRPYIGTSHGRHEDGPHELFEKSLVQPTTGQEW
jgi:hypothetical protein